MKRKHFIKASAAVADPPTETGKLEFLQCRATAGVQLTASEPWEVGKPVKFVYVPGGKSTITAGFRQDETITCTVEVDEQTATDLQESFNHICATEKQECFADEDHSARKATLRFPPSVSFTYGSIKGHEGVIAEGQEPTSYGAECANGKVYRSWSPEFATDAEYAKAKCRKGHWTFPDGVRGSESNPARIVALNFVTGAMTNKPAFRNMAPIKAKKAEGETIQAGAPKSFHIEKRGDKFNVSNEAGEIVGEPGDEAFIKTSLVALHNGAINDADVVKAFEAAVVFDAEGNVVKAAWSDAARRAAAEARKNAEHAKLDANAWMSTEQAHQQSVHAHETNTDTAHCAACEFHKRAADLHAQAGNVKQSDLHTHQHETHKMLSERVKERKFEPAYACDATLLDVYFVKAKGTSEGVKKGWESRKHGFPSTDPFGNKLGGMTADEAEQKAKFHDAESFKAQGTGAFKAHQTSRLAYHASGNAFNPQAHEDEEDMHRKASNLHRDAGQQQRYAGNWKHAVEHEHNAANHESVAEGLKWEKAGKPAVHFASATDKKPTALDAVFARHKADATHLSSIASRSPEIAERTRKANKMRLGVLEIIAARMKSKQDFFTGLMKRNPAVEHRDTLEKVAARMK